MNARPGLDIAKCEETYNRSGSNFKLNREFTRSTAPMQSTIPVPDYEPIMVARPPSPPPRKPVGAAAVEDGAPAAAPPPRSSRHGPIPAAQSLDLPPDVPLPKSIKSQPSAPVEPPRKPFTPPRSPEIAPLQGAPSRSPNLPPSVLPASESRDIDHYHLHPHMDDSVATTVRGSRGSGAADAWQARMAETQQHIERGPADIQDEQNTNDNLVKLVEAAKLPKYRSNPRLMAALARAEAVGGCGTDEAISLREEYTPENLRVQVTQEEADQDWKNTYERPAPTVEVSDADKENLRAVRQLYAQNQGGMHVSAELSLSDAELLEMLGGPEKLAQLAKPRNVSTEEGTWRSKPGGGLVGQTPALDSEGTSGQSWQDQIIASKEYEKQQEERKAHLLELAERLNQMSDGEQEVYFSSLSQEDREQLHHVEVSREWPQHKWITQQTPQLISSRIRNIPGGDTTRSWQHQYLIDKDYEEQAAQPPPLVAPAPEPEPEPATEPQVDTTMTATERVARVVARLTLLPDGQICPDDISRLEQHFGVHPQSSKMEDVCAAIVQDAHSVCPHSMNREILDSLEVAVRLVEPPEPSDAELLSAARLTYASNPNTSRMMMLSDEELLPLIQDNSRLRHLASEHAWGKGLGPYNNTKEDPAASALDPVESNAWEVRVNDAQSKFKLTDEYRHELLSWEARVEGAKEFSKLRNAPDLLAAAKASQAAVESEVASKTMTLYESAVFQHARPAAESHAENESLREYVNVKTKWTIPGLEKASSLADLVQQWDEKTDSEGRSTRKANPPTIVEDITRLSAQDRNNILCNDGPGEYGADYGRLAL